MKPCFRCGKTKPLSEFYRHPNMADGHLGKCKVCTREDVRVHRRDHDHVREADKVRNSTPERRAHNRRTADAWRKRRPDAYRAQTAVSNAVRDGRLKREPCETCGTEEDVHGHHEDYARPLDVTWLCARHHALLHVG